MKIKLPFISNHFFSLVILTLCHVLGAFAQTIVKSSKAVLKVNSAHLTVTIADNEDDITQGLSDKVGLPFDEGMMFVFPDSSQRTFWMYHCMFDVDIAFVSPLGIIEDIQTMATEPYDLPDKKRRLYKSKTCNVMYVIETNRDWFSLHNVRAGDSVSGATQYHSKVKDAAHWSR